MGRIVLKVNFELTALLRPDSELIRDVLSNKFGDFAVSSQSVDIPVAHRSEAIRTPHPIASQVIAEILQVEKDDLTELHGPV